MHFRDFVLQIVFFKKRFGPKGRKFLGKLLVRNFVLFSDARDMGCYFIDCSSSYLVSLRMEKMIPALPISGAVGKTI